MRQAAINGIEQLLGPDNEQFLAIAIGMLRDATRSLADGNVKLAQQVLLFDDTVSRFKEEIVLDAQEKVAEGAFSVQFSQLYHNDGNTNAWLNVKLVGTVSNRSAIGAKVRVNAFYRGASRWQLREISGGDGQENQKRSRSGHGEEHGRTRGPSAHERTAIANLR